MISTEIEYFTISENISADHEELVDVEAYDTFDEARSHICDKNRDGSYKYTREWSEEQECFILRYYCDPTAGMKNCCSNR